MTGNSEKLHVATPKGMQHATIDRLDATDHATKTQPVSLKALADGVLERNRSCNLDATRKEKQCNFSPAKQTPKVALYPGCLMATGFNEFMIEEGLERWQQPFDESDLDDLKAGHFELSYIVNYLDWWSSHYRCEFKELHRVTPHCR